MKHLITSVDKNSWADKAGIVSGSYLLKINDNDVYDIIDYEHLSCESDLELLIENQTGETKSVHIEKDMYDPIGLCFYTSLMSDVKQCKNHCLFCFIDQMRKTGRKTLHFKDDDWRLSLIMGNYITLTNVDDDEFERIIKRRVSPLYISVHATDGDVRKQMMRNPTADKLMQRLKRLYDEKLRFHAQIVLCPEINDGKILEKSITDLYNLYPYAQSVAVVPVGLTKFRENLYPLRCLTETEAQSTLKMIEQMQEKFLKESDTRFVFASDEMYVHAKLELPSEESFEDYPQIENGVGLLRKFEFEFEYALSEKARKLERAVAGHRIVLHGATGMSAYGFMQSMFMKLEAFGIEIVLHPIRNDYFGETVTVAGLVCAEDIENQLNGMDIDTLILPRTMLRESEDVFLDGQTLAELGEKLKCKVYAMPCHDGGAFLDKLIKIIGE